MERDTCIKLISEWQIMNISGYKKFLKRLKQRNQNKPCSQLISIKQLFENLSIFWYKLKQYCCFAVLCNGQNMLWNLILQSYLVYLSTNPGQVACQNLMTKHTELLDSCRLTFVCCTRRGICRGSWWPGRTPAARSSPPHRSPASSWPPLSSCVALSQSAWMWNNSC